MKYLYLTLAIFVLMACNMASPIGGEATAPPPDIPTSTPLPPPGLNEMLSLSPINGVEEDGTILLEPGTTVTVSWDGLPDGATASFVLSNFLADGGVMQIGQGTSATFVVEERIEGEVSATATLPDGTTVNALALPIVTANMVYGDCQYLPPALGPGVDLFASPDFNSEMIGDVIYDAEYLVLDTQNGIDNNGQSRIFYQIQHVASSDTGWVMSNVGENLAGDCSAFE